MSCSCFGESTALKKKRHKHDESNEEGASIGKTKNFSYNDLKLATNDFHRRNKIGRGGFGTVYKVSSEFVCIKPLSQIVKKISKNKKRKNKFISFSYFSYSLLFTFSIALCSQGRLKSGREIAVKKLSTESKQGVREFLTEIEAISNVHHPHLVELIGCCVHASNRILVYEFLENSSLDRVLLGSRRSLRLSWAQRSAICMGTARGLAYLHHELVPHIVHRDIKASNILLDKNFSPKIGDFGLAKLFPDDITHISTKIAGTTGYLAPEYVLGGQLTPKADVYSFGVLILEIVSGRSSAHTNYGGPQKLLLELAWELYQEGKLLDLVDKEIEGGYSEDEVLRYMKVALFCSQSNSGRRPSMNQIVEMLSKNVKLNESQLTPPGFFEDSDRPYGKASKGKSSEASTSRQMSSFPSIITEVAPR